jgi:transcriptional regulator with XRE-family HTH domain
LPPQTLDPYIAAVDGLDRVIARNLRELIEAKGLRHAELAFLLNANEGMAWTANRITQVVTERRRLSLLELAALCNELEAPIGRFLAGDDEVSTPGGKAFPLTAVRESLVMGRYTTAPLGASRTVAYTYVPTEEEAAAIKRLDLPNFNALLWLMRRAFPGTTITEERDRRVGDPAGKSERSLQALRGHAMRQILAELRQYIEANPIPPALSASDPEKRPST